MSDDGTEEFPAVVSAEFRRTALTRVVHVDGAWGGLTPTGAISMALYSERTSIPTVLTYDLDSHGNPTQRGAVTLQALGVTRDIEIEAIMTVAVAKALNTWLAQKIIEAENIDA